MENNGLTKKRQYALGEIPQAHKLNNDKESISKNYTKNKGCTLDDVKVLYTNADQLPNKKDDLMLFIADNEPDIIMITEVIPKQQKNVIPIALLDIEGYTHYFNFDIESENLGASGIRGTAIYVKSKIPSVEIKMDVAHKDHVWVEIFLQNNEKLICGCIYRSPSVNKRDTEVSTKEIGELLSKANGMIASRKVIAGDFNLKGIDWENDHVIDNHLHLVDFVNVVHENFLHQHVKKPTRHRIGENSNILDLIFSNEEGLISPIEHYPGLGKSDHECLLFTVMCRSKLIQNTGERKNFFQGNYTAIERNLGNINWETELTGDISDAYERFCNKIDDAMLGNIPKMKEYCKKKNLFMNKEALTLRNKKNKQWKKYKSTKDQRDHDKFKLHRNKLRDMTRRLRKDLESSLTKNIKTKPKQFWKYVGSRLVARSDIPTLLQPNNEKAITTQQKAETLNSYFSSVFTEEDESNIPDATMRNYNDAPLTSIEFTEESIKSKLLKMDENKSPGPDQIHPVFVKRLAHVLSRPLAIQAIDAFRHHC